METNIKIQTSEKEIIVREGNAPNVYDPEKLTLSGIISAPGDFAAARKSTFDALKTNVVADYTAKKITLTANEDSKFQTTITGALEDFPELADMNINKKKTYGQRELLDLIKFKGAYFKDSAKHTELMTALKKFEAKVNQEFENANDFKGAQATRKVVDIKTNLGGLEFILNIPMFTGGQNITFKVDICVDVLNGGVIFWLESVDLHDLQVKETETVFTSELTRLSDYVIIKRW